MIKLIISMFASAFVFTVATAITIELFQPLSLQTVKSQQGGHGSHNKA